MANKKPAPKKIASNDSSLLENMKKKWWAVLLLALFVFAVGTFAYNKYLDYKNVQDMKALLADFQELEKKMEEETGEEFTIEANCGSVGKFSTSYACSLDLLPMSKVVSESSRLYLENEGEKFSVSSCGLYSQIGFQVKDSAKDYFGCLAFHVRQANETKSEQIFLEYDKSPNSPY